MIKVSFITDEATQSFTQAIVLAKRLGLSGVELRSVENLSIDQISEKQLMAWKQQLDDAGLQVSCLSGSFYKCNFTDARTPEMEKLRRLLNAAQILGCDKIRGFAFFRSADGALPPEQLAEAFLPVSDILQDTGVKLLLEADPSVNTSNHAAVAQLLQLLEPALFGAIYDPGNDLYDPLHEQPYPTGYQVIRPYLQHVHVKDAIYSAEGQPICVAPGSGLVGWEDVLRKLISDGYDGWLSLETHYRKNVILTEAQMRIPHGADFTCGGMEATEESALALGKLLKKAEGEQG